MGIEDCVAAALDLMDPETRAAFVRNPKTVMRDDLGLTISAVEYLADQRADGGACDGVSFLQDGVILYAPTPHSRREQFTIAHELGHWLVDQVPGIYDWLADEDQPGAVLESLCDRIAQELLLDDSEVKRIIGGDVVVAQHVLDLYAETWASRPVCVIALARHLPGVGAVTLINRDDGVVIHSSISPDPEKGWPKVFPWKGQQLPAGSFLRELTTGQSVSRRLAWRAPWGQQAEYYVNAVADERRIVVIFSGRDLWCVDSVPALIERDFDTRPTLRGFCCGKNFEARGYPCPRCSKPFCPKCSDCPCERDAKMDVTCTKCFIGRRPHLMLDGICLDCRS